MTSAGLLDELAFVGVKAGFIKESLDFRIESSSWELDANVGIIHGATIVLQEPKCFVGLSGRQQ